ncbi:hypothetical protein BC835DRAFT_1378609 [Cytidiella melzeri]|nr:hypothetical protein BC835DRAFT_1378609 [Cytidiella melzeri]
MAALDSRQDGKKVVAAKCWSVNPRRGWFIRHRSPIRSSLWLLPHHHHRSFSQHRLCEIAGRNPRCRTRMPLYAAVKSITSEPLKLVYDAISEQDTQNAACEVLASGETHILVHRYAIDESKIDNSKEVRFVQVYGSPHDPNQRALGVSLWGNVERLIESGEIKSNRVEILPGGLAGIFNGLQKLKESKTGSLLIFQEAKILQ